MSGPTRQATRLACGALVLAAAGCGGGGPGRSILVYNGQHVGLTRAFVAAFEHASGITVNLRSNDGVVLADQLLQEGTSSPADVYLTENSPELVNLAARGLLARLPRSLLAQVPYRDRSPRGAWIGVALRISSLVYNPSRIPRSQLPRSLTDLATPTWKGKVAVAPLDSDFPPLVGALIATRGANAAATWLSGLRRNASVYQTEESVVAAVNRGDIACGIVNQYYWYRLRREVGAGSMQSRLYYFPTGDAGSVVNIAGAAVLASSRHPLAAERFVAFLVSPAGQRLISRGDDFEYPVRNGVAPSAALPPLRQITHASISPSALGNDRKAVELIVRAGFGS